MRKSALLPGGGNVERSEVRDQVLTRVARAHFLVDVEDLSSGTNVKGPAAGHCADVELAVVGQYAELPRGFLRWVSKDREIDLFFFCEFCVVCHGVDADHEIRHVEPSNQLAALTEGLALRGSTCGECLGKPGQHDGSPTQLGQS